MGDEEMVEGTRGNMIDIIYLHEFLLDMLLYCILYTGVVLIMPLGETLFNQDEDKNYSSKALRKRYDHS